MKPDGGFFAVRSLDKACLACFAALSTSDCGRIDSRTIVACNWRFRPGYHPIKHTRAKWLKMAEKTGLTGI
jgi:hypothetical protein